MHVECNSCYQVKNIIDVIILADINLLLRNVLKTPSNSAAVTSFQ